MLVNNVCDVVNVQRINYWIAAAGHVIRIEIAGVAVVLKGNSKRWCWRVTLNESGLTDSNFLFRYELFPASKSRSSFVMGLSGWMFRWPILPSLCTFSSIAALK